MSRRWLKALPGAFALLAFATCAGFLGVAGSILPLIMTIFLTALEFLVAALQAYVFAVLTCMYLNDAIHPGH